MLLWKNRRRDYWGGQLSRGGGKRVTGRQELEGKHSKREVNFVRNREKKETSEKRSRRNEEKKKKEENTANQESRNPYKMNRTSLTGGAHYKDDIKRTSAGSL